MYPRLEINISKLKKNLATVSVLMKKYGLSLTMVTKAYCADMNVVPELAGTGLVDYLADSRIENLKKMGSIDIPKILLRIPMPSEADKVVEYADISFNSELDTIRLLNEEAAKQGKIHKIVVMVDLGDLREGYFHEQDLFESIEKIKELDNISIIGLATNLTCYGGVLPSKENLSRLVEISKKLESDYGLVIEMISGGNSSSLFLLKEGGLPEKINNLRIGEAILLGRETAFGNPIEGAFDDAFRLVCEVIENKKKDSLPIGEQGMDAFGNKPVFKDKGIMQRAIVGIGRQDVLIDSLIPEDAGVEVIGASSDHTIVDVTGSSREYRIGDKMEFKLTYSGILSLCTSMYVEKCYIK